MGKRTRRQFWRTLRSAVNRRIDACFPDAAEVRLLELCGGMTLTIGRIKRDGRPFTLILSEGQLLKSEKFRRVASEHKAVLYMNDIGQVICIQASDYDRNVVAYQELEDELLGQGLRVAFIPERWLANNPLRALNSVKHFIYQ